MPGAVIFVNLENSHMSKQQLALTTEPLSKAQLVCLLNERFRRCEPAVTVREGLEANELVFETSRGQVMRKYSWEDAELVLQMNNDMELRLPVTSLFKVQ